MKPAEIFEKHPGVEGAAGPVYRVGGSFVPYAIVAVDKRFTEAELAAEWWAARLGNRIRQARCDNDPTNAGLWDHYEKGLDQEWVIERFAALPHYYEADQ